MGGFIGIIVFVVLVIASYRILKAGVKKGKEKERLVPKPKVETPIVYADEIIDDFFKTGEPPKEINIYEALKTADIQEEKPRIMYCEYCNTKHTAEEKRCSSCNSILA